MQFLPTFHRCGTTFDIYMTTGAVSIVLAWLAHIKIFRVVSLYILKKGHHKASDNQSRTLHVGGHHTAPPSRLFPGTEEFESFVDISGSS